MKRIQNFDPSIAELVVANCMHSIASLSNLVNEDPSVIGLGLFQTRHSLLASRYLSLAKFSYALGRPIEEVKQKLTHAADSFETVFTLKGNGIRLTSVVEEGKEKIDTKNFTDASLTSSAEAMEAGLVAFSCGKFQAGISILMREHDPDGVTYVGPDSEVCRPIDQAFVRPLKRYLGGHSTEALQAIQGRNDPLLPFDLMRAVIEGQEAGFWEAFDYELVRFGKQANKRSNRNVSDFYLSTKLLGLAKLAQDRGIISTVPDKILNHPGHVYAPVSEFLSPVLI